MTQTAHRPGASDSRPAADRPTINTSSHDTAEPIVGDPFDLPSDTGVGAGEDVDPGPRAAQWHVGEHLADLWGMLGSVALTAALGAQGAALVNEAYRRVGQPLPETLHEAEMIPVEAVIDMGRDVPTLEEVVQWCERNDRREPRAVYEDALRDKKVRDDRAEREREEARKAQDRAKKYADDPAAAVRALFPGPPLALTAGELPPFPVGALPSPYCDMVRAVATFTQTDPGMAGMTMLGTLAAATQRCVDIEVRHGWSEPLSLFVVTVAEPSERKSSVFDQVSQPLRDAEDALVLETEDRRVEKETLRDIATAQAADAKKVATKAATNGDAGAAGLRDDAVRLAKEAAEIRLPPIPRLIADDITAEALGAKLFEHGERLAVMASEGGIFATMAGRYNSGVPNIDVYLKGYSGDACRVDRMSGGRSEKLTRPALTLVLAVQPVILESATANTLFVRSGLMARTMIALPPSRLGRRDSNPPTVDAFLAADYHQAVETLTRTLSRAYFADGKVGSLKMSEGANRRRESLSASIEPRLGKTGDFTESGMNEWAGKHVGRVCRIAGLLHLAEHGPEGVDRPVGVKTFTDAERIGEYATAHTAAAFAQAGSADVAGAEEVLRVLRKFVGEHRRYTFPQREIRNHLPRSMRQVGAVDAPLALLERLNWVIVETVRRPHGGTPSVTVTLNPDGIA
ncbi:hypothetical protein A2J03_24425 [Rhodococcus sp. EPR-157]|uniref:YfjI family protein n=1 Tax=Rhodococcus sp. EPR-157 TaxID=1813677 RepID=UPI0007BB37F6|nr:YfjI family protein [Rhodococcus sp. EPR-157]KZF06505.1 hypothetical protein A2J03_24425 [Rhodococcus sp. EPR-157]